MINKVILVGNLGRDPEVRSTPSGQTVATFSVATNRRWNDRDGNRQEQTEWHNIVVWGRQGEVAGRYLTRGRQVYVEGRLQTRSWDDRETGEKRYRTEIVCESFQMLGPRQDAGNGNGSARQPASGHGQRRYQEQDWGEPPPGFGEGHQPQPEDDDLPF